MTTLKEALHGKLTEKELETLRAGFDVIGTIAIIEVSKAHKKKQKIIAETLLSILPHVKTVAAKQGRHTGKYRRQPLKILAGEKTLETCHKENGIIFTLNVSTCYYSPRLGTERMRIASQIKKGENILVVGSGIGPYPLVLAKHTLAAHITAVEHNPIAHEYAQLNTVKNKLGQKITLIKGDLSKVKLGKFDRIISNIPHKGVALTPKLLKFAKKGTILHVYDFVKEEELQKPAEKLEALCKKANKKCTVLQVQKAGQHAVRSYRVCVDAKVI